MANYGKRAEQKWALSDTPREPTDKEREFISRWRQNIRDESSVSRILRDLQSALAVAKDPWMEHSHWLDLSQLESLVSAAQNRLEEVKNQRLELEKEDIETYSSRKEEYERSKMSFYEMVEVMGRGKRILSEIFFEPEHGMGMERAKDGKGPYIVGSFDGQHWWDPDQREYKGSFDYEYDEEEFDDHQAFMRRFGGVTDWFPGERGREFFELYRKQYGPLVVRKRNFRESRV